LEENYDNLPGEDLPLRNDSVGGTLANLFLKQAKNKIPKLLLQIGIKSLFWKRALAY